jgi:hypothetical protein
MATAINQFETIESIRFFASLVGTDGVSMEVRDKVNEYLLKLVTSLEASVNETTAKASGITLL